MKELYIDLMEKSLSAYSNGHILRYFNDVKKNGLTEHGFPRLTANIGILIAHKRRADLLYIFLEMMEFCCKSIPKVLAANDFSVREIVCCIIELEENEAVDPKHTCRWREYLSKIEPTSCYNKFALDPSDDVRNWALFTGVSEYFRLSAGIGGDIDFIELQIASQLKFFDENGMYMDNKGSDVHHPILYDIMTRALFTMLLGRGYRGRYYEEIDAILKKAGLLTLSMQSSNGELAFGGRSNQFLHNEPVMATVYEYEANRYAREGDLALAAEFKARTQRAIEVTKRWLSRSTLSHIKNRFPVASKYGCEGYAYFDKYMITVASNLYAAYLICDEAIPTGALCDRKPVFFKTSEHFHKVFVKCGGYSLEFDTNADPHYDASGLGRVHRDGATSAVCLACPCPAEPSYTVDIVKPVALSICSAVWDGDRWELLANKGNRYELLDGAVTDKTATAHFVCHFYNGENIEEYYEVSEEGVFIAVKGEGRIGYVLPAFCFDGMRYPEVSIDDGSLSVKSKGWICRYTFDGELEDLQMTAANRNGHYGAFLVSGRDALNIHISIFNGKHL